MYNGRRSGLPGPNVEGAQWLIDKGAAMFGSDTPAFEVIPSRNDSVHAMLSVDRSVHIIEDLDLEVLAADKVYPFLYVGLPLRMAGATGSPLRLIAIA